LRRLPSPLSKGSAYLESGMSRPKIRFGGKHFHLPASRWVRIALGTLFVLGGIAGFLPVLGFWMVPLGLLLLALDVALLRRPTARTIVTGEHLWGRLRRAWRAG
jgi:hypothetical protein